tara:strand:+ start:2386 stop:3510 length:1125 start_codon:yes stop_codon:yes gene_type:complete
MYLNINKQLDIYEKQLGHVKNIDELNDIFFEIKKFLKEHPTNYKIYFLLGNIMWKKLQIDEAIFNYKESLKINPNFLIAKDHLFKVKKEKMDLITYLMYENPKIKATNSIIKCHQLLQNINYNLSLEKKITDDLIINIYNDLQKIISLENLDTDLEVSQIHRDGVVKYNNCNRYFEIFNTVNVIPKNCFSCYKVQIQTKTVIDLIKIYLIFDNLNFPKNLTRKCMIEMRPNIKGSYKAFIYCIGFEEAKDTLNFINPILDKTISKNIMREIKRGCSEFAEEYVDFKEADPTKKNFMKYNIQWKEKEEIVDRNISKRNQTEYIKSETLNGITLKDALVINNWLYYAKIKGDLSYKLINQNPTYSKYIDDKLKTVS